MSLSIACFFTVWIWKHTVKEQAVETKGMKLRVGYQSTKLNNFNKGKASINCLILTATMLTHTFLI